jgi:hypothetical protein
MAITTRVYLPFKRSGITPDQLETHTLKLALLRPTYTPDYDADEFYADLNAAAPVAITSSSVANPTNILTGAAHGLTTGDQVLITGHAGSTPAIAGSYVVTVVDATNFTIPVNVTVGGTGGTVAKSAELLGSGGYTVGGKTIDALADGVDIAGDFAYLDGDDVVWTALTPSAAFRYAALYDTTDADRLIFLIDFGADQDPAGFDFPVRWPVVASGGVLKVV